MEDLQRELIKQLKETNEYLLKALESEKAEKEEAEEERIEKQNEKKKEIKKIVDEMKLLEEDIKGAAVDTTVG